MISERGATRLRGRSFWRTSAASGAAYFCLLGLAAVASTGEARSPEPRGLYRSRFTPANRCVAIESVATRSFVRVDRSGAYRADRPRRSGATGFFAKPTGLGTYMLHDPDRRLVIVTSEGRVGRADFPGPPAGWALRRLAKRGFSIRSTATRRQLAVWADGRLVLADGRARGRSRAFRLFRQRGCRRYPEAAVGVSGRPFKGTARDGELFGFVDAHLHITADMRAGGRVISGEAFDRFGITEALGRDYEVHGAGGSLDVTGNLLRSGTPIGSHDTHGWPTFVGWPVHDTYTHQQVYYAWLKRAWEAGERLVVAQTVEDEPLCRIEPLRSHSCNETRTIRLEIRRLRALRHYVDAQSGGPGRGWFRLVYSPRQARRAIKRGKLAVLIGVESSNLFGCSEKIGAPQCTRADVDRGIRLFRSWGVRTLFVAHWVDNAFAGAALEGGAKGVFINGMEALQTGHYFRTGPCPEAGQGEQVAFSLPLVQVLSHFFPALTPLLSQGAVPAYPPGRQCNVKGLTRLGRYLIRRLMANHILIEADHLSERARLQVLAITERHHYPLVSSHTGTGGHWTPSDLTRLNRIGGFTTVTLDDSTALVARILELSRYRKRGRFFGVGLGTDTGGFNTLPGPDADARTNPLHYPFRSYDRKVKFARQRSGDRTYDLNADGVAHYGLVPDELAAARRRHGGGSALRVLFRSAQAYLDTWRRALAHR